MKLSELDPRFQIGALLVAVVAAGAVVVSVLHLPLARAIGRRAAEGQALRHQVAEAQALLPLLPDQQAALQRARVRLEATPARFGSGHALARILDQLRAQAEALRLGCQVTQSTETVSAASPSALLPLGALRGVPVQLTLTGRYRQVGQWLGTLRQGGLMAHVDQLSVVPDQGHQPMVRAEVQLTVFLMPETAG